jgi:hypothetical protein
MLFEGIPVAVDAYVELPEVPSGFIVVYKSTPASKASGPAMAGGVVEQQTAVIGVSEGDQLKWVQAVEVGDRTRALACFPELVSGCIAIAFPTEQMMAVVY